MPDCDSGCRGFDPRRSTHWPVAQRKSSRMITGRSGVRLPLGQPVCAMRRGRQPGLISLDRQVQLLGSQPSDNGAVAQLGERLDGIEKVMSSILVSSTIMFVGEPAGAELILARSVRWVRFPCSPPSALVVQWKNAPSVRGRPWVRLPPRAPFAGVAEWLGPGPPPQSREFDSPRPLQVECSAGSTFFR